MKRILITLTLSIVIQTMATAQNKPVENLFRSYIEEINNLNKAKKIKRVTRLISKEVSINQTIVGMDGKTISSSLDFPTFTAGLKGLISAHDLMPNLTIDEISNVSQGDERGTLTALVSMNLSSNGKLLDKSFFLVNIVAAKFENNDNWQIIYLSNVQKVEERNAGNCICYIYKREDRYASEVIYPSGFEYKQNFDSFVVKGDRSPRTITTGDEQYLWTSGGNIQSFSGTNTTTIGSAKTIDEAIFFFLGKKYKDHCLAFDSK